MVRAALLPNLQLWEQTLSTTDTPIRLSQLVEKSHVYGFYAQLIFESQEIAPNPRYCYTFDIIEDEGPVLLLSLTFQQERYLQIDVRLTEGIQTFFESQAPKIVGIIHALCPKAFESEECTQSEFDYKYPNRSLIY